MGDQQYRWIYDEVDYSWSDLREKVHNMFLYSATLENFTVFKDPNKKLLARALRFIAWCENNQTALPYICAADDGIEFHWCTLSWTNTDESEIVVLVQEDKNCVYVWSVIAYESTEFNIWYNVLDSNRLVSIIRAIRPYNRIRDQKLLVYQENKHTSSSNRVPYLLLAFEIVKTSICIGVLIWYSAVFS